MSLLMIQFFYFTFQRSAYIFYIVFYIVGRFVYKIFTTQL